MNIILNKTYKLVVMVGKEYNIENEWYTIQFVHKWHDGFTILFTSNNNGDRIRTFMLYYDETQIYRCIGDGSWVLTPDPNVTINNDLPDSLFLM